MDTILSMLVRLALVVGLLVGEETVSGLMMLVTKLPKSVVAGLSLKKNITGHSMCLGREGGLMSILGLYHTKKTVTIGLKRGVMSSPRLAALRSSLL